MPLFCFFEIRALDRNQFFNVREVVIATIAIDEGAQAGTLLTNSRWIRRRFHPR
jgi:hypothetical protein